jgi:hypothetical protein
MASWSSQQKAAAGGILAMVLLIVGYLLPGQPPKYNASATSVASWFADNHRAVLIGLILTGLAVPLYVWFLANLAVAFREAGQPGLGLLAAGGGLLVAAAASIADALTEAVAHGQRSGLADDTVRGLYHVSLFAYQRLSFAGVAFGLAVAFAAMRGLLPGWVKWVGLVQALALVLTGVSIKSAGFFSPTGGMALIGYLAYFVGTAVIAFGFWQASAAATSAV